MLVTKFLKTNDKEKILKQLVKKERSYLQNNDKDNRRIVRNNITYWEQKLPSEVSLTLESTLLSRTVLSLYVPQQILLENNEARLFKSFINLTHCVQLEMRTQDRRLS